MKSLLVLSVALTGLAGVANAADMPVKAMPKKAPPPVVYEWSGFYIGGYAGTAIGNQQGSTPVPVPGSHIGVTNVNRLGGTLGATAGYNWQFDPHWLIGLEGDLGWMGLGRGNIEFDDITMVGFKTGWYATTRVRGGYVTGPSLLYLTAGGAFVHGQDEFGGDTRTVATTFSSFTTASWTAGAGIETKLSRNWSTKTEYLYIDGGDTHNFIANPRGVANVPSSFDHNFHVIKTGLNYRFGGPNDESLLGWVTAPPMPSNHNWNGFYAGVNAGGGISHATAIGTGTIGVTDINGTGLAGGGQIGYNLLLGPKLFAGVEGDFGALRIHAQMADWFDQTSVFTEKTDWYGTTRVRFGTTTGPALLYVTGGAAWVHNSVGFTPQMFAPTAQLLTRTGAGWTVGAGTEVALDARWSARIESLYIDTGHSIERFAPPSFFGGDFKDRFMVVRAGVNYQFGGGL